MNDAECIALLRWALPRLQMRWRGFRKVRRQVCRRIARRMRELGLETAGDYRRHLAATPAEWPLLDAWCRVTISRFWRDRGVFEALRDRVLPQLARQAAARGEAVLRVWSAGCASGEEPYSVALAWRLAASPRRAGIRLEVTATDADPHLLERARQGLYPESSLRDLPPEWRERAFTRRGDRYRLLPQYRNEVAFEQQDVRRRLPDGRFHLVLCRNLVFTYFDEALQRRIFGDLADRLAPGGVLLIGAHEALPADARLVRPLGELAGAFQLPFTEADGD